MTIKIQSHLISDIYPTTNRGKFEIYLELTGIDMFLREQLESSIREEITIGLLSDDIVMSVLNQCYIIEMEEDTPITRLSILALSVPIIDGSLL